MIGFKTERSESAWRAMHGAIVANKPEEAHQELRDIDPEDIVHKDTKEQSLLWLAIKKNNLQIIKALAKRASKISSKITRDSFFEELDIANKNNIPLLLAINAQLALPPRFVPSLVNLAAHVAVRNQNNTNIKLNPACKEIISHHLFFLMSNLLDEILQPGGDLQSFFIVSCLDNSDDTLENKISRHKCCSWVFSCTAIHGLMFSLAYLDVYFFPQPSGSSSFQGISTNYALGLLILAALGGIIFLCTCWQPLAMIIQERGNISAPNWKQLFDAVRKIVSDEITIHHSSSSELSQLAQILMIDTVTGTLNPYPTTINRQKFREILINFRSILPSLHPASFIHLMGNNAITVMQQPLLQSSSVVVAPILDQPTAELIVGNHIVLTPSSPRLSSSIHILFHTMSSNDDKDLELQPLVPAL